MTSPAPKPVDREPAWGGFVDALRAFVAGRVPAQDAEDVAQEALLRIHRGAGSLRDPDRLRSWVYGVTRRTIADHYRGRGPEETAAGPEPESVADPTAAVPERLAAFDGDHSAHEEVLSWLRPMAEALPDGYREALLLADFEGRTQREVAERLGLSVPGAKSRVQRARRMLASELERCCSLVFGGDGEVEDFRRNACDC